MIRAPIPLLLLLLLAPAAAGQEARRPEPWERALADEPALVEAALALEAALAAGDARALGGLFRREPLRLLIRSRGLPAGPVAHARARALLAEWLRGRTRRDFRISVARLEPGGDFATLACDLHRGQLARGRPLRERLVAGFVREGGRWRLAELCCP
ncbi:MAG: hypothetical protein JW819_00850 [Candidatus Krumholzibacteriota bacterium]|nr:hypothetical protein [Candidatus Krumholzibacteriota bacterium]